MTWKTALLLAVIAIALVALTIHMHRGQDIFHGKESSNSNRLGAL